VSDVGVDWFEVSLIPETLAATTLGAKAVGDSVNIETDIIARHVERMLQFSAVSPSASGTYVTPSSSGSSGSSGSSSSSTSSTSSTERSGS
jgi:predicted nucleic acid-binding Zn ribbon protein